MSKKYFHVTKNKFPFLCITKFYIAHWQHVDLLRSSTRNKETFNPSFTVPDIRKQLLRVALVKSSSYYPGLIFVKNL